MIWEFRQQFHPNQTPGKKLALKKVPDYTSMTSEICWYCCLVVLKQKCTIHKIFMTTLLKSLLYRHRLKIIVGSNHFRHFGVTGHEILAILSVPFMNRLVFKI